jgi:hypothetical protein
MVFYNKSQFAEKNWGNFEETSEGGPIMLDIHQIRGNTVGRRGSRTGRGATIMRVSRFIS